jgi:hypothetical protein
VGAYTSRGFVEVLAASQSNVRKEWFQGTADAVRQYMWLFEEAMRDGVQDFLILSGELCGMIGGAQGGQGQTPAAVGHMCVAGPQGNRTRRGRGPA